MDETRILKPKDPSTIVKLQDPTVIEQLLENPPAVLAELLAGWFSVGNGFMAAAGCRIAQAAFKGRVFEQFGREFKQLRDKGKIPDDFMKGKYGEKSWVELITTLDEEIPDEDRLKALSAMFYSVNKLNLTDGEKIANYQLFQIAKRLTSGQLLLLKVAHERTTEKGFTPDSPSSANVWLETLARRLGHQIMGLVEQDERVLMQNGLLTGRQWSDESGINDNNGRLTSLAFKFCENLKTYRTDLDAEAE
jgi:DNA-binding transcriptional regulator of glucitol operon